MGKKEDNVLTLEAYREQMNLLYSANNIIREKTELYFDFISSLIKLIDETYLGPEVISNREDRVNHFIWCFNKVLEYFEHERIKFSPISYGTDFMISTTGYDYLWNFFYRGYYTNPMEDKSDSMLEYFTHLFNFNEIKSPTELELFIDFYKIFDQNLKKLN